MFSHGLVFRHLGKLFLALFDEEGNPQDADVINDPDGIYDDLPKNSVSIVTAEHDDTSCNLRDLKTVSISHESTENALEMMIKEGSFPTFARQMWEEI
jgi:hypothetical protein